MRRAMAGAVFLAASALPQAAMGAPAWPAIYAFGDSLSDAGNYWALSSHATPISPPYDAGRYSNGPVWIQLLAASVGPGSLGPSELGGTDFAVGGAQSGTNPVHQADENDLPGQLHRFLAQIPVRDPQALYTIWIGSNDLFDMLNYYTSFSAQGLSDAIDAVVSNEINFVAMIVHRGAAHVLIGEYPELGLTPAVAGYGSAAVAAIDRMTVTFDTRLAARMTELSRRLGFELILVDGLELFREVVADPARYHFADIVDPCWSGTDSDPVGTLCGTTEAGQDRYLFWDDIHPTARGHELIAVTAEQALAAAAP